MFGIIKKIFIELLTGIVSGSNNTKCVTLRNQKCMTQPTLINLDPNEYSQELRHYPFAVKLDRCIGSCNTLNDLSNKVCVPNKTEESNLRVLNMIRGINESINGGIMIKVDVSVKNIMYVKRIIFGILLHVVVNMENI